MHLFFVSILCCQSSKMRIPVCLLPLSSVLHTTYRNPSIWASNLCKRTVKHSGTLVTINFQAYPSYIWFPTSEERPGNSNSKICRAVGDRSSNIYLMLWALRALSILTQFWQSNKIVSISIVEGSYEGERIVPVRVGGKFGWGNFSVQGMCKRTKKKP